MRKGREKKTLHKREGRARKKKPIVPGRLFVNGRIYVFSSARTALLCSRAFLFSSWSYSPKKKHIYISCAEWFFVALAIIFLEHICTYFFFGMLVWLDSTSSLTQEPLPTHLPSADNAVRGEYEKRKSIFNIMPNLPFVHINLFLFFAFHVLS